MREDANKREIVAYQHAPCSRLVCWHTVLYRLCLQPTRRKYQAAHSRSLIIAVCYVITLQRFSIDVIASKGQSWQASWQRLRLQEICIMIGGILPSLTSKRAACAP